MTVAPSRRLASIFSAFIVVLVGVVGCGDTASTPAALPAASTAPPPVAAPSKTKSIGGGVERGDRFRAGGYSPWCHAGEVEIARVAPPLPAGAPLSFSTHRCPALTSRHPRF